ncbi:MAG: TatD family hydrolase [Johnsonella sp.]|nr:TatD family hydrolase [Johnsonella sp.]
MIDTHTHYNDEAFAEDRDELIRSLPEQGIERAVNIGADMASSRASLELAKKYKHIYASVGVHPSSTGGMKEEDLEELARLAREEKVLAIGEVGLDYYWDDVERSRQQFWFRRQIALAAQLGLPLVIHSREAAKDTLDIMKEENAKDVGGVMHCYAYGPDMAKEFMKLDFFFGIGGVSTFKNAKKLIEVIEYLPMEKIVLETDCPYLAPEPYRGKRNSSLFLPQIVSRIAQIKGLSEEEVIYRSSENAHRLYPRLS